MGRMRLASLLTVCLSSAVSLTAAEGPKLDFGTIREEHLMIPMRDGVRLSAYVFFPPGEGKWPASFGRQGLGQLFVFFDRIHTDSQDAHVFARLGQ